MIFLLLDYLLSCYHDLVLFFILIKYKVVKKLECIK